VPCFFPSWFLRNGEPQLKHPFSRCGRRRQGSVQLPFQREVLRGSFRNAGGFFGFQLEHASFQPLRQADYAAAFISEYLPSLTAKTASAPADFFLRVF